MAKKGVFIGVDIGGTKINTVLVKGDREIISRHYLATGSGSGVAVISERIISSIKEVMKAVESGQEVLGIGMAVAGLVDSQKGIIYSSPNIPDWENFTLKKLVEENTGVFTCVNNDANLAAIGEHIYGAGIGVSNLIYITVSTGIGGGILIDGELFSGSIGTAGEIGHMTIDVKGPRCSCGNTGCWEAMASGTAIAREARTRMEKGEETIMREMVSGNLALLDGRVIETAARRGDRLAQMLIADTAFYLGVGLANLVNLFNPEMIILGGGLMEIGEPIISPAERVMKERAYKVPGNFVKIRKAALGADSGAIGAVAYVRKCLTTLG